MIQPILSRAMAIAMACVIALAATLPTQALAAASSSKANSMVSTETVLEQQNSAEQRAQIQAFLQRDDVRQQLQAMGVSPAEAESRVDSMSDREVAQIADQIAEDPAGQGIGWVIGVAILIAAIIFITDVIGVTNVYPFVNP